jgi:hypothetical protein
MNRLERARAARLNAYQRRPDGSIGRGRDHWAMVTRKPGARLEDYLRLLVARRLQGSQAGEVPPGVLERALQPPVKSHPVLAYVNHNRWGASCECGGFDVVDQDDPRFYCIACYNVMTDGRMRMVRFPKDREGIERALRARPNPTTRHLKPGEKLGNLVAENLEHGLPAEVEP